MTRSAYIPPAIPALITWLLTVSAAAALAQSKDHILSREFETEISYPEALSRLDTYYQKEIKKRAEDTLPRVAENIHFEVWREMWFVFEAKGLARLRVRIDSWTSTGDWISKEWMEEAATLLGSKRPPAFKDAGPVAGVSATVPASAHEIAAYLGSSPSGYKITPVPNWRTPNLYLCVNPRLLLTIQIDALMGTASISAQGESADAIEHVVAGAKKAGRANRS